MKEASRAGVDWFFWRVVTDNRMKDSLADIRQHWSIADLVHAHMVLDIMDAAKPDQDGG